MPTNTQDVNTWAEIRVVMEPESILGYRTEMVTYEESLTKGRFVGRSWNAAGFLNDWESPRLDPARHPTPQAFWLEIDGQLLASHWQWQGFEQKQEQTGLHAIVALRHEVRPITVQVHTLLDGTPVMTRWLEVTNIGTQPAALAAAYPWSGVLKTTRHWRAHMRDPQSSLYSVGYMVDSHWGDEGNFQWQPLPNNILRIDGRFRRDRHRHPMFVLRNNATGEHFVGQLAWTGGYSFEFDLDADPGLTDGSARLFFRAGPDAPAPQRIIAAGETVRTPEMHLGLAMGGLDEAIQSMHDHLRRSVFMPQPRGHGGWLESGIGPELEITVPQVFHAIENAGKMGAEVFFIDASWYAPPYSHWWTTVGDWHVDLTRFPQGLKPFRDRVHELGMLWGLWMDAERIGEKSRVAQEHPDWIAVAYDGEKRLGGLLDIAQPAACQWMEGQISRLIEEQELEFFRLDYNVGGLAGWNEGVIERSFATGLVEGTLDGSATADLRRIGREPGYELSDRYQLMVDLDFTGEPPLEIIAPANARSFTGVFEGDGHTVRGLQIGSPTNSHAALFGWVGAGAMIRDLRLVDARIAGTSVVGGIVGSARNSTFTETAVSAAVTGRASVGGIVGDAVDSLARTLRGVSSRQRPTEKCPGTTAPADSSGSITRDRSQNPLPRASFSAATRPAAWSARTPRAGSSNCPPAAAPCTPSRRWADWSGATATSARAPASGSRWPPVASSPTERTSADWSA